MIIASKYTNKLQKLISYLTNTKFLLLPFSLPGVDNLFWAQSYQVSQLRFETKLLLL
jgi:hypothetical protein